VNKEERNEQRKLLATFFNNVGTGIISVGVLTPTAALILGLQTSSISTITLTVLICIAFVTGFCFHFVGRLFLIGYEGS